MGEDGGGAAFPLLFFDGEREIDIGTVQINPDLEYKPFQVMLSRKIGISPNQISIYLVNRKKIPGLPFTDACRRIPITGKVNFGLICKQNDCSFLVVLKRSRKSRYRREKFAECVEFSKFIAEQNGLCPPAAHMVPEKLVLLRRNQPAPFYDLITQSELDDLNNRLESMRIQREVYQLAMGKGKVTSSNFNSASSMLQINPSLKQHLNLDCSRSTDYLVSPSTKMLKNDRNKSFCEECVNAIENVSMSSFHLCVRDEVITRFVSRLGPIHRPNKHLP